MIYVLAFRNRSLISTIIRLVSRGKYSHVALEFCPGAYIQATSKGKVNISSDYSDVVDRFVVLRNDLEIPISSFLGQQYDYFGALMSVLHIPMTSNSKYFCSELVAKLLGYPRQNLTPSDLVKALLSEKWIGSCESYSN